MRNFVKNKLKEEKGLTLIELLAVIVILGIIAAIAIPAIGNIIENSRYNAVKGDALNVLSAAQIYYSETKTDTEGDVSVDKLKTDGYLETAGKIPDTATVSKASPRKLTAKDVKYSGDKTITFNGATTDDINKDDQKGSAPSINAIGG
ncbi:prepilin-type N-terminal cleavage/methylation domain-containing protein [Bhargavaea ullalensis]|uniref:Type IV pilus assembly protein PilA n=1 Tax=Bhargavaea ullalensis TaxID=1265685 RepID=A0ABV2G8N0_9BACL